ncbi:CopG family transcriptional regulator [uncultured Lamprocystis sp.]|jgi:Arc/MetJ-type ribon-helix-helix transcriptional regulator|uniref:CopG family transcriptional regulator n=1 Tax=uncultured Lamprocystis sp. TaxID=543132 RepID=UPI0025F6B862|nr:CopG family transcriptional regulator [uncultured Lamprocystis sp.]
MRTEKLSISLTPEAIGVIDAYRSAHAIKSRSQVIEQALRRLREDDLESAYREAAATDAAEWDATAGDGLSHEPW